MVRKEMGPKHRAILNQVCHQRNREADAVAQLCGEIAANEEAWQAKWNDPEQVRAQLAKLDA
jgi:hypothetical protein